MSRLTYSDIADPALPAAAHHVPNTDTEASEPETPMAIPMATKINDLSHSFPVGFQVQTPD
jgi:hypothetical protein